MDDVKSGPPDKPRAPRRRAGATLADVAELAGVSLATASRVLNDATDRVVGKELRRRVLEAAETLDYAPNAHARALASARSSTVGIIVHDVSDPYFAAVAGGIIKVATDNGLLPMICHTYRIRERELEYVSLLRGQRVQSLILVGSGFADPAFVKEMRLQLDRYSEEGGKAVAVSRHELPINAVMPDNYGGARQLAQTLARFGHERIAVISGPPFLTTVQDRFSGFRDGLAEAGIELDRDCVVESDFTREGGYRATEQLVAACPDVTAVFAANDLMAVGALAALRDASVAVPTRLSLVGFDDISIVRDLATPLTTVRIPMARIGERAMELALKPPKAQPVTERVPLEIVVRESTAPPP